MSFEYIEQADWPPLAWIASWSHPGRVEVRHGRRVEVRDEWFGEVVWKGDFENADFDRTDIVYGSGCVRRNGKLRFVTSAMTTDRLQCISIDGTYFISNSLACLLAQVGADVDPTHVGYGAAFSSIINGIFDYDPLLSTTKGPVSFTYFKNLEATETGVREIDKPAPVRDLSTYSKYRSFLEVALLAIGLNMASPSRRFGYEFLGTISTGFDSPTVTALARNVGCRRAITMASARDGLCDSGHRLGEKLDVETVVIGRDEWRKQNLIECPFIASDAKGEDVYFAGARDELRGKVLLTGYAAGAWARRKTVDRTFKRADQSGLSLTEYRLHAGFIHVPVPPMGSLNADDQHAMMWSPEMDSWCSGKRYDKPFCRRVLVEAGLQRDEFATQKKAASVLFFDRQTFLSAESLASFEEYLRKMAEDRNDFASTRLRHGITWQLKSKLASWGQASGRLGSRVLPLNILQRIGSSLRLREIASHEPLFDFLFPWALKNTMQNYRATVEAPDEILQRA